eukprot:CAMPEP_0172500288 /NCGR_PEP_ID=MMETSP1066-20121228/136495_1 /TAXON_ID=671091 /ORGANISM="Coscinodiscus wailesii, Strain CCMP2513" /LENGTH=306 /DNA_ID=CAMNT_0013274441 /DNA_START=77 /DNA_END=996 /DNA_ORIENTATION=+
MIFSVVSAHISEWIDNYHPRGKFRIVTPAYKNNSNTNSNNNSNSFFLHFNLHKLLSPSPTRFIDLIHSSCPNCTSLAITFMRDDFIPLRNTFCCVNDSGRQSPYQVKKVPCSADTDSTGASSALIYDSTLSLSHTVPLFGTDEVEKLLNGCGWDLSLLFSFEDLMGMRTCLYERSESGEVDMCHLFVVMVFSRQSGCESEERECKGSIEVRGDEARGCSLPDVVLREIMEYGSVEDLFKWRVVAKRWKRDVDAVKIKTRRKMTSTADMTTYFHQWCEDNYSIASIGLFVEARYCGYDPQAPCSFEV